MLDEAARAAKQLAISGRKILFVATKKQAKEIVEREASRVNMPFVTERWLGGNANQLRDCSQKYQADEKH